MCSCGLLAVVLLTCAQTFTAAQSSCKDRCGKGYNRGNTCQCDYSCLGYGECCKDFEPLCTTKDSCKGRCGESFRRGRPCSCDAECTKYNQCCPDFEEHCDQPEPTGQPREGPTLSEGSDPDDHFFPTTDPTSFQQDDPDASKQMTQKPDPSPAPEGGSGSPPADLLKDATTEPPLPDLDGFEVLPDPETAEATTALPKDETTPASTTAAPGSAEPTAASTAVDADDPTTAPEPTTVIPVTSAQPTTRPTTSVTEPQTEPAQTSERPSEPTEPSAPTPETTTVAPTTETTGETTAAATAKEETTAVPESTESTSESTSAIAPTTATTTPATSATAEPESEVTTPAAGLETTAATEQDVTQSPMSSLTAKPAEKPSDKPLRPVLSPEHKPVLNGLGEDADYQADDSNDTDLCSGRPISGATTLGNGTVVVFRGPYFWVLDRDRVPGPARGITDVWGTPSPIDTVFTRCNCQGKTYIFKGPQYWRYENDVLDPGYPKVVQAGFDGLRGHITAALSVPQHNRRRESVYFFKRGGNVQKYSYQYGPNRSCGGRKVHHVLYTHQNRIARQVAVQVSLLEPEINYRKSWRGFPNTITAAVSIPNRREPEGYSYHVFSGSQSYRIKMNGERPVIAVSHPQPSPQSNEVFKCSKKTPRPQ